ncbi:MAG: GNAT family N-acetyltransferase [Prevotella sp.]|nr:GNAT family N-acetyltransferase [Prevotella sp.]
MEVERFHLQFTSEPIADYHCLEAFHSGVEAMDRFIQGDFRLSIEHHYCTAYGIWAGNELVAIYALSFDSLDLDTDDKEELESGIASTGVPNVDWNYKDTFYAKSRYPALDIAYLAVQEKYRGQNIGRSIIHLIAEQARSQKFAGCQFLTVDALATKDYSAVGFYEHCGFTANEVRKPYKDTLRMYRTLYVKDGN